MKYGLLLFLFVIACQTPERNQKSNDTGSHHLEASSEQYPEAMKKVLERHGGVEHWRNMKSLSFEIVKESGNEKHYIQLLDRRTRVEGPNFTMGFDGTDVWMEADTAYKGTPEFYHNLMFYFYAMPFVLADDGIIYEEVAPLEFDEKVYPGIGISYYDGVGFSSKDEYFIYYDPDTYQMTWLGYTVTYYTNEKSEDIHWIRYASWDDFAGIKLPTTLTWYNYDDGNPTVARNDRDFIKIHISREPLPDHMFEQP